MTINFTTFYTRAGKAFFAGDTTLTAVGTTVHDEVEDFVQELGTPDIEFEQVRENIRTSLESFQSAGAGLVSEVVVTPVQPP